MSSVTVLLVAIGLMAAMVEPGFAVTNTVGPSGANYTSIQAAINDLDNIDPSKDSDLNPYHTILIQAGTYSTDSGESWQTHTTEGAGRGTVAGGLSQSLIVINDVDEDLDGDGATNNYLAGLHIVGAGVDKTIIDGQKAANPGRLVFTMNSNVVVRGMTLKGGQLIGGWKSWQGAGIQVAGAGSLLEDMKVEDCEANAGDDFPSCVNINGTNAIVRRVEVTNYRYGAQAAGGCAIFMGVPRDTGPAAGLVDRCYVHDCHVAYGGIGVSFDGSGQGIIFGSLVVRNTGSGLFLNSYCRNAYFVNCTVAENTGPGVSMGIWSSYLCVLNCILSDNGAPIVPGGGDGGYMFFMHNVMDESGFAFTSKLVDGYGGGSSDDGTNDMPPVDPKFKDQTAGDYTLLSKGPAVDNIPLDGTGTNAFVLTGGTAPNQFVYVDVNKNGVYDQQLDVIVRLRGYAPTSLDWVSDTDLRGRKRLAVNALDAGCYEFQPPAGTVVMVK